MSETVKKGVGFFTDNDGNPSSMRLMSLMSLVTSMALAFIAATSGNPISSETVQIIFVFMLGAFAPKTVSKFAESK